MYAFYKDLIPPSAVQHAFNCNLIHHLRKCLIISSGTRLSIYILHTQDPQVPLTVPPIKQESTATQQPAHGRSKLELYWSCSLLCAPQSIAAIRMPWNGRDALLLAFPDAKLSVLEWDATAHDLRTLSLHSFEDLPHQFSPFERLGDAMGVCAQPDGRPPAPTILIDPDQRCCALLLYGRTLAFLAFRSQFSLDSDAARSRLLVAAPPAPSNDQMFKAVQQQIVNNPYMLLVENPLKLTSHVASASDSAYNSNAVSNPLGQAGAMQALQVLNSFQRPFQLTSCAFLDLKHVVPEASRIIDLQLLPGFTQPTLAVLYESASSWPGMR